MNSTLLLVSFKNTFDRDFNHVISAKWNKKESNHRVMFNIFLIIIIVICKVHDLYYYETMWWRRLASLSSWRLRRFNFRYWNLIEHNLLIPPIVSPQWHSKDLRPPLFLIAIYSYNDPESILHSSAILLLLERESKSRHRVCASIIHFYATM